MTPSETEELIKKLIEQGVTMVTAERFNTITRNAESIKAIAGDVIECGVWNGGMSIFLTKLFEKKKMWIADSFDGFQPLDAAIYEYSQETHTPDYDSYIRVGMDTVLANFDQFNVDTKAVKFLPGFVKDTLPKADIKKIALLRIDVDAYSATREVLDALYHKVSIGGYVVFDDSCLAPTIDALCDFFEDRGIIFDLKHPETDEVIPEPRQYNLPCGCYIIKKA